MTTPTAKQRRSNIDFLTESVTDRVYEVTRNEHTSLNVRVFCNTEGRYEILVSFHADNVSYKVECIASIDKVSVEAYAAPNGPFVRNGVLRRAATMCERLEIHLEDTFNTILSV